MTNTEAPPLDPVAQFQQAKETERRRLQTARQSLDLHKEAYERSAEEFRRAIGQAHTNEILTPQEVEDAADISPAYRRRLEVKSGARPPTPSQPLTDAQRHRDARARKAARKETPDADL